MKDSMWWVLPLLFVIELLAVELRDDARRHAREDARMVARACREVRR